MSASGASGDSDEEHTLLEVTSEFSYTSESETHSAAKDSEWEDEAQDLTFEQVLFEERELLNGKREQRDASWAEDGGTPFSLAFSGGGIRAAAFQAGVLWRLAEVGRLKDVDYLTAVSGGGYIAASYASHLLSAEKPADPSEVNGWYRDVVARTICRMQRNAGDFVRDCVSAPGVPEDGAGCCPRACDLPVLLVVLFVTIWTNPVIFLATVLIPVMETVEIFFGPLMREAFCESDEGMGSPYEVLMLDPAFWLMMQALAYLTVMTFLMWLVSKLPFANSKTAKLKHPMRFLFMQSSLAALLRCCFALVIFLTLVISVPYVERFRYDLLKNELGGPSRRVVCTHYMCANSTTTQRRWIEPCEQLLHTRRPWTDRYCSRAAFMDGHAGHEWELIPDHRSHKQASVSSFINMVGIAMVVTVVGAIVLLPCFPWLLTTIVLWLGPFMLFLASFLLLQFRVFGQMTGQKLMDVIPYEERWVPVVSTATGVGMLIMFFSDHVHGLWHWYYRRCLQTNFFDGGVDKDWEELRTNAYCPLVIMTGTVNDFMRPIDKRSISEISFSPLHTGSIKCGYVRTLPFRSLAQTTALTGAGCLDALSLSMSNKIRMRFWLEVLNLGWGDFILFESAGRPCLMSCAQRAGRFVMEVYWQLHRAPTMVMWGLICVLYACGWQLLRYPSEANCRSGRDMLLASIALVISMSLLSFFSFLRCFNWLMYSPVIRRMQEASRFYFRGLKPPGMLYVTDGGVQDCTALMQLMRRRCRRILLVLAAADPCDDLGVLRTTMDLAVASKIGCFYDPRDPRRDVKILLDEFKKDLRIPYLHLGIRYGWDGPAEAESFGRLIIVKNRIPEGFGHQPVRPLLTEEEIRGELEAGRSAFGKSGWGDLMEEDLGGFGCCDCCHTRCGNAGRKFPHLSFTGYMYLTPQLFSSLSRLGRDVSEAAVQAVMSADDSA